MSENIKLVTPYIKLVSGIKFVTQHTLIRTKSTTPKGENEATNFGGNSSRVYQRATHSDLIERLSSLVDGVREQNRAERLRDNQENINESPARLFPSTKSASSAATLCNVMLDTPISEAIFDHAKPRSISPSMF